MPQLVMSIDQGTTGSTVLLINKEGTIVAKGYHEFPQIYPQPGWVEHDAQVIWDVTLKVIQETWKKHEITAQQINSIGITNQRETTVIWDRATGKPIHNAIVWQCRRTASLCQKLKEDGWADKIRSKTGLVLDAYFSGTKIAWLLDNVPGARERAEKGELAFGTIDSWLLYNLTGGKIFATDFTNASRTMVFNIHEKKWDKELLELLHIPEQILPEVKNSSCIFGTTDPALFDGTSIPISGIAGDQQAALYGQGCWDQGMAKNTYGTGCFLVINTGEHAILSKKGLLTTLACDKMGKPVYALEGSVFIAGAAVQWLRDELQIVSNAGETEAIAKSIENTGGVYLVPAFAGLGAPYWDSDARGALVGMTRGSGRAEIIRATLESIAYQAKDLIETINEELQEFKLARLKVDGGACQNDFLMQFQSDILGMEVDRPKNIETTAFGAAFLAGLATGFWSTPEELQNAQVAEKVFQPKMSQEQQAELYKGWKKAVERVRL